MGGYGCGGQNRTHDYTSGYKRLDSFVFGKLLPLMEQKHRESAKASMSWTDGSSIGFIIHPDRLELRYAVGEEKQKICENIYFDGVDNNYGGNKRIYFICPFCGRRCRIMYMHRKHFKCRLCANLNYLSQQVTKGTDTAAYKMDRFLRTKFDIKGTLAPEEAEKLTPDRQKGMHFKTYFKLLRELRELQAQYMCTWIGGAYRILGR